MNTGGMDMELPLLFRFLGIPIIASYLHLVIYYIHETIELNSQMG